MTIVVNVSDAQVSDDTSDTIATYSLGSCIGVSVYDPEAKVAGMLHFQLPSSEADKARAQEKPCMFADTGFQLLLAKMGMLGAEKKRLRVGLIGGAQMLGENLSFSIGRRNHAAIRKLLWQQGVFVAREEVGGTIPRTVKLNVADGSIDITSPGEKAFG